MFNILSVSPRTVSKILRRMKLACFRCGWSEAICDIHHIIPRSKGGTDDHDNLTILCPNCHRVAHEKNQSDFPTLQDTVGDKWKEHYFTEGTKNPRVRKQISEGMKVAHAEGRSSVFGNKK
jgi:5-methylcytosine-specific restriction endonuclease McrA